MKQELKQQIAKKAKEITDGVIIELRKMISDSQKEVNEDNIPGLRIIMELVSQAGAEQCAHLIIADRDRDWKKIISELAFTYRSNNMENYAIVLDQLLQISEHLPIQ